MADMYGAIRSNEFAVKDVDAVKTFFEDYSFGDVEMWEVERNEDGSGIVAFGGEVQYPSAYPMVRTQTEDEEADLTDADLDEFAAGLRQHLQEGEVFYVIAGGNEKMRYVSYQELIIAQDIPDVVIFENHSSSDSNDFLRKRFYE